MDCLRWLVPAAALLVTFGITLSFAQEPHCPPGQQPRFVFEFADLKALIGEKMGQPLSCEFPDPSGTGDVHQRTSTGLAYWRKSTNTPTFTNGWEHRVLTEQGLVSWTGDSVEPPSRQAGGSERSTVPALAAYLGENGETYLLRPDGTSMLLTAYPTQAADIPSVAWDPTAQTVATTRPVGITSEVLLISVASGEMQAVPGRRERNCGLPRLHPDGVHVVAICGPQADTFARSVDLFHRQRGYVPTIVQGGTGGIQFVPGAALFSPTGAQLVVQEFLGDGAVLLWRVDPTTGSVESYFAFRTEEYAVRTAAFLADGRILATSCAHCTGAGPTPQSLPIRTDIVLLTADGSIDAVLHSVEGLAFSPALAPDGETLLFTSYSPDSPVLWMPSRPSGEVRRVGVGEGATFAQAVAEP